MSDLSTPSSTSTSSSLSTAATGNTAPSTHRGKTVLPPRNSTRLTRPPPHFTGQSTPSSLGPPAEIDFKVPSIPSHPAVKERRRPLTMNEDSNLPTSDLGSPIGIVNQGIESTPSRLKRLSLVARPAAPLAKSPSFTPNTTPSAVQDAQHAGRSRHTTPRGVRMRSSISYSPAAASAHSRAMGSTPRSPIPPSPYGPVARGSLDMERSMSVAGDMSRNSMDGPHPKGETWSERHADLLHLIAQKQRRINELKQELQTEQSALYSLKAQWTSLVSTTFASPPPATGQTSTLPIHRTVSSTSTTSSQPVSTLDETGSVQGETDKERDPPGFQSLLDDVLGKAPLVDPSVVEGGKRFLGNLMRTVGAAAGGTVPEEGTSSEADKSMSAHGQSAAGMDFFRGMFSWSSAPPKANTVRIRPVDTNIRTVASTPSPVRSANTT